MSLSLGKLFQSKLLYGRLDFEIIVRSNREVDVPITMNGSKLLILQ